jgi:hypothetical protein
MGEGTWHFSRRDPHWVLVGKPGGNRPLGRPGRRWEHAIQIDLQEIGSGNLAWFDMAKDRLL